MYQETNKQQNVNAIFQEHNNIHDKLKATAAEINTLKYFIEDIQRDMLTKE